MEKEERRASTGALLLRRGQVKVPSASDTSSFLAKTCPLSRIQSPEMFVRVIAPWLSSNTRDRATSASWPIFHTMRCRRLVNAPLRLLQLLLLLDWEV